MQFPFQTTGGPEAARFFGEIASAAEAAQAKIDRANRRATIGLKAVNATMADAKGIASSYAASLGPVGSGLQALGSAGPAGAAIIGIVGITGALVAGAKAAIGYASSIKDGADRLGIGTESFQAYGFAARQAGVDQGKFQQALGTLVLGIGQAQVGTGKLAKALKDTDAGFLSQLKAAGSTEAALDLYIKKVATAGSVQEQARLAAAGFGRTMAVELIPFFAQGAAGIDALKAKAHELGIVIADDLVQSGESAGDKLEQLSDVIKGNLTTALLGLAPILGATAEAFAQFVASIGQSIDQTLGISLEGKIKRIQTQLEALRAVPTEPAEGFGAFSPAAADKRTLEAERDALTKERDDLRKKRDEDRRKAGQASRTLGAGEAFEQGQAAREKKSDDPEEKIKALEREKTAALRVVRTAVREEAIDVKAGKEEKLRIEAFYAAKEKDIRDKASADKTAAAKRDAKTQKDLTDDVKKAQQGAAASGQGKPAQIWIEAQQAIDNYAERVQANVTDEKQAAKLIGDFRVATEKKASDDIFKAKQDDEKKAADAAKSAAKDLSRIQRDAAAAGATDVEQVWLKAQDSIDDFSTRVTETVKDSEEAAKLIAAFRVATEQKASEDIADIRDKAAAKARDDAEKAQKDAQDAAEKTAKPFLDAVEHIGASLTDALVDGFLSGEKQAKKTSDVLKDLFTDLAKSILGSVMQKGLIEPLQQKLLGLFGGQGQAPGGQAAAGPQAGGGGGFLDKLLGMFSGGGGKAPAATAPGTQEMVGPLQEGQTRGLVEATGGLTDSTKELSESTSSLSSTVAGLAAVAVALGAAGQSMAEGRKEFSEATMGASGSQEAKNAITAVRATLVAVFTAAGAAAGAAAFGIGALPGAAIGAAVGNEIGKAIEKAVIGGIKGGVKEGVNQAQLDKKVSKSLADDLLLTIVFAGTNKSPLGAMFGKLFSPDIENIFAKIFRQILGGTGGFSTEGVAVKQRGFAGFNPPGGAGSGLVTEAQGLTKLIASAFGAGGQAFGDLRQGYLTAILLGAVRKEMQRSIRRGNPSPADLELARAFATAFQGNFYDALKTAFQVGGGASKLVVSTFAKAQALQPSTFQRLADLTQEQGRVPLGKARKASTEAFGDAIQAAFKNAADSTAFRHSLEDSVQNAFAKKAVGALDKGFGQLFAPFFALSKDDRREFQRAKRRGQFVGEGGALDILTTDFVEKAGDFAKIVADPAFLDALKQLDFAFLKLQVEMSVASGDIDAAAAAIEAHLAPAIQLVKDTAQFQRDVRSRIAVAQAGPGFAAQQANVDELRVRRQEAERTFSARMGGATLGDFGRLLRGEFPQNATALQDKGLVAADQALTQQSPRKLLAAFQEFADARLSELEAELNLAREQAKFYREVEKSFKALSDQAKEGRGLGKGAAGTQERFDKAQQDAYLALADGLKNPDLIANMQESLSAAISEASQRADIFGQFVEQFKGFQRQIDETLGRGDSRARITELLGNLDKITDPTDPEQMGDAANDMSEAIQLATERFQFFTQAAKDFANMVEGIDVTLGDVDQSQLLAKRRKEINELLTKALGGDLQATQDIKQPLEQAIGLATGRRDQFKAAATEFEDFAEQAMLARRGRRGQRQVLATRRGEIQTLLATAQRGGEGADDALTQLRKLLPETLALGQQTLSGRRLRSLAAELEQAGTAAKALSDHQVDLAEQQLEELREIARLLGIRSTLEAHGAQDVLDTLFKRAGDLGLVAQDQQTIALGQLVQLGLIADAIAGRAGTEAADAEARATSVQGQLTQFRKDIEPVITYLTGKAGEALATDLQDVVDALGKDGEIVKAIDAVKSALPVTDTGKKAAGGPVTSGRAYWVGEQGPEIVVPEQAGTVMTNRQSAGGTTQHVTISAPVTLHVAVPGGTTRAEADELGRTLAAPIDRQIARAVQRAVTQFRKVA